MPDMVEVKGVGVVNPSSGLTPVALEASPANQNTGIGTVSAALKGKYPKLPSFNTAELQIDNSQFQFNFASPANAQGNSSYILIGGSYELQADVANLLLVETPGITVASGYFEVTVPTGIALNAGNAFVKYRQLKALQMLLKFQSLDYQSLALKITNLTAPGNVPITGQARIFSERPNQMLEKNGALTTTISNQTFLPQIADYTFLNDLNQTQVNAVPVPPLQTFNFLLTAAVLVHA